MGVNAGVTVGGNAIGVGVGCGVTVGADVGLGIEAMAVATVSSDTRRTSCSDGLQLITTADTKTTATALHPE